MTTSDVTRQSPIHHLLEPHDPQWRACGGALIAWRFQEVEVEGQAMRVLGLCDLSPLPKLGVNGPAAARWLEEQGIAPIENTFDARRLADGGWAVRVGADSYLLESGAACDTVPALDAKLGSGAIDLVRVVRQEATFLLTGARAPQVLSQTCAIDFRDVALERVVWTRMAGISCIILPHGVDDTPRYRIWLDPSYAVSLWESLYEICGELGGQLIGAETAGEAS